MDINSGLGCERITAGEYHGAGDGEGACLFVAQHGCHAMALLLKRSGCVPGPLRGTQATVGLYLERHTTRVNTFLHHDGEFG